MTTPPAAPCPASPKHPISLSNTALTSSTPSSTSCTTNAKTCKAVTRVPACGWPTVCLSRSNKYLLFLLGRFCAPSESCAPCFMLPLSATAVPAQEDLTSSNHAANRASSLTIVHSLSALGFPVALSANAGVFMALAAAPAHRMCPLAQALAGGGGAGGGSGRGYSARSVSDSMSRSGRRLEYSANILSKRFSMSMRSCRSAAGLSSSELGDSWPLATA
ncbi:hypothetical protein BDY21DRAFT_142638 [Lineolata rhizophorae]|uniref:Uncharacterized protein n=1 Tax=Lineolata rhizophorae TaxID=578093 RepID=A0A6A6NN62_9PEZI|nr:hypothetical protein BDY21DRAFT_142638 [Lineolata rhizophorae]